MFFPLPPPASPHLGQTLKYDEISHSFLQTPMYLSSIIERVIIYLVRSSKCPVDTFTDISFIMAGHRENVLLAAIPQLEKTTSKAKCSHGTHF